MEKERFTRNDRRLTDRKNESGIGANRDVSGALRSGIKKFFTANIIWRICVFFYLIINRIDMKRNINRKYLLFGYVFWSARM